MSQAQYRQPGRTTGKGRVLTLFFLVTLLCLASFAIGLMVGKSGKQQQVVSEAEPAQSFTHKGAEADSAEPTRHPVAQKQPVFSEEAVVPLEQGSSSGVVDSAPADNIGQKTDAVAEHIAADSEQIPASDDLGIPERKAIPLGSGINPAKAPQADTSVEEQQGDSASVASAAVQRKSARTIPPEVFDAEAVAKKHLSAAASKVDNKAPVTGNYVVQVAAFRKAADAQRLVSKLRGEVIPAFVREVDLGEKGIWNRVLAGPVANHTDADALRLHIKRSMNLDGFVKKVR